MSLSGSDSLHLLVVAVYLQVMNLADWVSLHPHQCSSQLEMSHSVVSLTKLSDLLLPTRSPWHTARPSKRVTHHVRVEDPGEDAC